MRSENSFGRATIYTGEKTSKLGNKTLGENKYLAKTAGGKKGNLGEAIRLKQTNLIMANGKRVFSPVLIPHLPAIVAA